MALASAPFQFTPNQATKAIALPVAWEDMDIKQITLSMTKPGANKIRCIGFSNGTNNGSDYTYDDGANVGSNYTTTYCLYAKEYSGGAWVTKVAGTADLSTAGEIWFTFTNYDSSYNVNGIAIGDIA